MARSWISGGVKIVEKDRGWKELKSRLMRGLDGLSITTGVQDEDAIETTEKGTPYGQVAAINEFGAPSVPIPPRPFLGTAFEKHNAWRQDLRKVAIAVVDGADPANAMLGLAEKVRKDIVRVLDSHLPPPNAPSTIAKKGHGRTLEDQGRLRQLISARVRRKGAKVRR